MSAPETVTPNELGAAYAAALRSTPWCSAEGHKTAAATMMLDQYVFLRRSDTATPSAKELVFAYVEAVAACITEADIHPAIGKYLLTQFDVRPRGGGAR